MAHEDVVTSYKDAPTRTVSAGGVNFAYRELGPKTGVPVIFLTHLAAVLDNWDPRVVDGIAAQHRVITFDNRGVGASTSNLAPLIGDRVNVRQIESQAEELPRCACTAVEWSRTALSMTSVSVPVASTSSPPRSCSGRPSPSNGPWKRCGADEVVPDELLHLSPLAWEHIILTGEYRWGPTGARQPGQRREPRPAR